MRICLISSEHSPWGGIGHSRRRQATLLATRHEVTLIHSEGQARLGSATAPGVREIFAKPSSDLVRLSFSCEEHRLSAGVMEAIEDAYDSEGPDLIEACDYRAAALVPLQARQAGHALLKDTLFCTQLSSASELLWLHDGVPSGPATRLVADLERAQMMRSDHVLWRGGDTLDLYRRYYEFEIPRPLRIRSGFAIPATRPNPLPRDPSGPLRILYVGRLQRCKGALDLADACLRLPGEDWQLTMIGADTATAPMGQSVQMTIEAMWGEDPRLRLQDPLPHEELQALWDEHDLLVVPSRFEVWSNVALEAMRAGLPILATPVGGLAEIVEPGVTGWQTDGVGADALGPELSALIRDREKLERVRGSGAIFDRFRMLCDPDEVLAGYDRLFSDGPPSPRPARRPPVRPEPAVTAVVPYNGSHTFVESAVESLLGQTHRNLEVLIVNDGSFQPEDEVLARLAALARVSVITQVNRGEPSARNLGACLAGGEYLAMLDADNVLEPEFVARGVELLRREPTLAYVTSWLRFVAADGTPLDGGGGYVPLGNAIISGGDENWDGDAIAILPRKIFSDDGYRYEVEAGLASDWELYRRFRVDGRFGAVIPELLARYRVHPSSLTRAHSEASHARSWEEAANRRALRATRWTRVR